MGIVGSKDETGKIILGSLPPGFLDERGKQLRDELDACLEKNMWWFSIGGVLLTIPICIKFKTERPFYTAAVICPVADMYFGTLRCTRENDAFREHYKYLQEVFNQPVGQLQPGQPHQQQQQQYGRWRPPEERQQQQQQQQLDAGGRVTLEQPDLAAGQQQPQPQEQQQTKSWWRRWG